MKYYLFLLLLPCWSFAQISDTLQLQTTIQTVHETSGLIWHNERLWTHDDSGGATALYQVNPQTGATERTVFLAGITNVDWEDLAKDDDYFYIGDFGNNSSGNRRNLQIYKVPITVIESSDTITADQMEIIHFVYPEQTNFSQQVSNSTDFDCEAMLIFNQQIHLFTKEWSREFTVHYTLPTTTTTDTIAAQKMNEYPLQALVTAADISPAGDEVYLLAYGDVAENANPPKNQVLGVVLQHFTGSNFLNGTAKIIEYNGGYFGNGQVEGATYRNSDEVWISAEAILFFPARLYLASLLKTPIRDINSDRFFLMNVFPNPTSSSLQVALVEPASQNLIAEIIDSTGQIAQQKSIPTGSKEITFDFNKSLHSGSYFLRLLDKQWHLITTRPFQIQ